MNQIPPPQALLSSKLALRITCQIEAHGTKAHPQDCRSPDPKRDLSLPQILYDALVKSYVYPLFHTVNSVEYMGLT